MSQEEVEDFKSSVIDMKKEIQQKIYREGTNCCLYLLLSYPIPFHPIPSYPVTPYRSDGSFDAKRY